MSITKNIDVTDIEQMTEFLNKVDFQKVENFIVEEYGIPTIIKYKITQKGKQNYVKIFSEDNLVEYTGTFKNVLRYMKLEDFGVFIRVKRTYTDESYNTYTDGEITMGFNIDMKYEQFNGGSNGMTLFWAEYSESNGWKFSKPVERT